MWVPIEFEEGDSTFDKLYWIRGPEYETPPYMVKRNERRKSVGKWLISRRPPIEEEDRDYIEITKQRIIRRAEKYKEWASRKQEEETDD